MEKTRALMNEVESGVIFNNLVDFDALYGHRRNPVGYADCLREFDAALCPLLEDMRLTGDALVITADHGNDPTMPGSDHTREYVPLLVYGPRTARDVNLGVRDTFADIGATLAEIFGVKAPPRGRSFLEAIT
jgi:phosphopentomutase